MTLPACFTPKCNACEYRDKCNNAPAKKVSSEGMGVGGYEIIKEFAPQKVSSECRGTCNGGFLPTTSGHDLAPPNNTRRNFA